MRIAIFILLVFSGLVVQSQEIEEPGFTWGNSVYVNLDVGESFDFKGTQIKLLHVENHYNTVLIGSDTVSLKVSRRSLPLIHKGIRLFVADNIFIKQLARDKGKHGLLKKDILICVSESGKNLLDRNSFYFPVSFNRGYHWDASEDSHMFSYDTDSLDTFAGIGIDLNDSRGVQKHWVVALENTTVVWVEDKKLDPVNKQACVLLASNSSPGIYYVYDRLYNKNIEVRKGQKIMRGELLGTIWGNSDWGHLQLAVVMSDSVPSYNNRYDNCVNFFPQLFQLYHNETFHLAKSYSKGSMQFGRRAGLNRNCKNNFSFEEYSGRGWKLGKWCTPDKVNYKEEGAKGNVRLQKVQFKGSAAECVNPRNFYDYEINVRNGVYRIRTKIGDVKENSWQKIEFEGVAAGTYTLDKGEQVWTGEKAVKVTDRRLTVRIYVDPKQNKVAGISDLVFQRAY